MHMHYLLIVLFPPQEESTNDFELGEKIGSGTSGAVLKAMWKSKNMMVAVKKIHVTSAETIQNEVHFHILYTLSKLCLFQVAIMKSLRHKNIVFFHGYYQDSDGNHLIILGLFNRM